MAQTDSKAEQSVQTEKPRDKKKIQQKISYYISLATGYVEIVMGCIIMAIIVILTVQLILDFPENMFDFHSDGFTTFLSDMLTLVVGLEFVKMLCMHTADTVIEVLMFATARQMIVEHLNAVDTLIGIITIGILFAIRKYLLMENKKKGTDRKLPKNQEQQD
ncbi:MAG: phosphate-starvation-inducible PsiE family protein [Eubacteriales bacterium]|nr:phosphate-starvation-inducible PsiE family protein [Eubacteriales bacterium]